METQSNSKLGLKVHLALTEKLVIIIFTRSGLSGEDTVMDTRLEQRMTSSPGSVRETVTWPGEVSPAPVSRLWTMTM